MSIEIILLASFRLNFQEEGVDYCPKDLSERAIASVIFDCMSDELGERTWKKVFNGRRHYRHGIQHRITNLILQMVVLFAL